MAPSPRVLVWNEHRQDKTQADVISVYPNGINAAIADGLREQGGLEVRCATLDDPDQGCSEAALAETDVLFWWAHTAHHEVDDAVAERVARHVHEGMGLVILHSGHGSKVFRRILGTSGALAWREDDGGERLWNLEPSHPIAEGVPPHFELEREEMYGERFDIPTPEMLLFLGWYPYGEVFRSGCVWSRGHGRVFYFQPGHETHPTFYHPHVRRILGNAARWCAARVRIPIAFPNVPKMPPLPGSC